MQGGRDKQSTLLYSVQCKKKKSFGFRRLNRTDPQRIKLSTKKVKKVVYFI